MDINSLDDIDNLFSDLCQKTDNKYDYITCNTGCAYCCYGSNGLPLVYNKEWERVRIKIKSLDSKIQTQIFYNFKKYYYHHSKTFEKIEKLINNQISDELNFFNKAIKESLANYHCPLLIDNKCSVYDSRPSICRAFGYFSTLSDNKIRLLTCDSDNQKFIDYSKENDLKGIEHPIIENYHQLVIDVGLNKESNPKFTILPMWLNYDLNNNYLNIDFDYQNKLDNANELIIIGDYLTAEKIYLSLNEYDDFNFELGNIKFLLGDYQQALLLLEKSLKNGNKNKLIIDLIRNCIEKLSFKN